MKIKNLTKAAAATLALGVATFAAPAAAEANECMIGEVRMFAGNFAPRNWAFTHGQLLPISQNTALFSVLGTTYGGDGRTSFGLPDLRGRVPMGTGQGPGLSNVRLGFKTGSEQVSTKTTNVIAQRGKVPVHAGSNPPSNLQPSLGLNYIICLYGVYPSRS